MTQLKFLCVGDPHLKTNNVQESECMIKEVLRVSKETSPDVIVCMGDVLDRFSKVDTPCLKRAITFFEEMAAFAPLYVLIGNHDRPNNTTFEIEDHAYTAVKKWDPQLGVTVIDKPTKVILGGMLIVMMPYLPVGQFVHSLNSLDKEDQHLRDTIPSWNSARVIFAHQEFYGVNMSGQESTLGDKWAKQFPLVVSGHIHQFQELNGNIIYVGSPSQLNFGDTLDKSVSLLTLSPTMRSHKRYYLTIPVRIDLVITYSEINTCVTPVLPTEDSKLRIIIKGTVEELKRINKLSRIIDWRKKGYYISTQTVLGEREQMETVTHQGVTFVGFLSMLRESLSEFPDLLGLMEGLTKI